MKSRLGVIGLFSIVIGIISLVLEAKYYRYVGEDGVLHESLFLPLGVLFLLIGCSFICVVMLNMIIKKLRNPKK